MITAVLVMGAIGLVAGLFLSVASKKFHVDMDPREEELLKVLPLTNCGACGFPGCAAFAKAVLHKEVPANACVAGGVETTEAVSRVMGVSAEVLEKEVAVILCKGGKDISLDKYVYIGVRGCQSAALISGGPKSCGYGCIGFGTCERVCPFDAITMGDDYLPIVDEEKCTGCTICAVNCPKHLIKMLPLSNKVHVRCNSLDKGNVTRKNCSVGCIGCMKCVKICPHTAITLTDNLAVINPALCTNCGECVPVCPTDTIENYIPGEKLSASAYPKEPKKGKDEK